MLLGRQIGFTLTLAGIAGFIVAIGVAADSFVIYFERLKDEIREGRSLRSAAAPRPGSAPGGPSSPPTRSPSWPRRALRLAIGDVKGFAFTLGLSTVLDLVVVFLFPHPIMACSPASFGTNRFSGLGQVDHSRRPAARPR